MLLYVSLFCEAGKLFSLFFARKFGSLIIVRIFGQTKEQNAMKTQEFTYSLVKETTYRGVTFSLYNSTEGWFVETSQGLVTEYMKTKKEALDYVRKSKNVLKIESK